MNKILIAACMVACSTVFAVDHMDGCKKASAVSCRNSPIEFPFETTRVVIGDDVCAKFAFKEFNEIVEKSTGKKFVLKGGEKNAQAFGSKRIFIGRSAESEKLLGKDFFNGLKDEESVVLSKDENLFLVGGGQIGALYAVYDFVEDNLGYRWYFKRPDGEVIKKLDKVVFCGLNTRNRPAFRGARQQHSAFWQKDELYVLRNRGNQPRVLKKFMPNIKCRMEQQVGVHSLYTYLPPVTPYVLKEFKKGVPDAKRKVLLTYGPYGEAHPEWYTLNEKGQRIWDVRKYGEAQVCLSNPEARNQLYENMKRIYAIKGGGLYKLDSMDRHNSRYCWCDNCIALEKKYNSIGGPLWDTALDICARLKRDGINDVYIGSLAYKGPEQTEKAPDNVVFPDNFVIDEAYLNYDRSVSEVLPFKLKDGTIYNKFENLKKWSKITKHRTWWYYGGGSAINTYSRMSRELKELYEVGVQGPGACGYGGGHGFEDMLPYVWYYMLRYPHCDDKALFRELCDAKFGAAGEIVAQFIEELEAERFAAAKSCEFLGSSFIPPEKIVRWQKMFDVALEKVKGDEKTTMFVRTAREDLDIWTLRYSDRITKACPDFKIDFQSIYDRCYEASQWYWKRVKENPHSPNWVNTVARQLESYANYPNLKTKEFPKEITKTHSPDKIIRFLPPRRFHGWKQYGPNKYSAWEDKDAVANWAWMDELWDMAFTKNGTCLSFQLHSESDKKWLWNGGIDVPISKLQKGKYNLICLGKANLRPRNTFVLGNTWGSPLGLKLLDRLYDPTYDAKEWEIWVSVKVEGPKFYPEDKGPNRLWCDVVYVVDLGVPEGR